MCSLDLLKTRNLSLICFYCSFVNNTNDLWITQPRNVNNWQNFVTSWRQSYKINLVSKRINKSLIPCWWVILQFRLNCCIVRDSKKHNQMRQWTVKELNFIWSFFKDIIYFIGLVHGLVWTLSWWSQMCTNNICVKMIICVGQSNVDYNLK